MLTKSGTALNVALFYYMLHCMYVVDIASLNEHFEPLTLATQMRQS